VRQSASGDHALSPERLGVLRDGGFGGAIRRRSRDLDATPGRGSILIPFLGRRIESADVDGAGNLVLAFGGGTVRVQRDDSGYESYQIAAPDLQVIV
jgi:hypothetical protein